MLHRSAASDPRGLKVDRPASFDGVRVNTPADARP